MSTPLPSCHPMKRTDSRVTIIYRVNTKYLSTPSEMTQGDLKLNHPVGPDTV